MSDQSEFLTCLAASEALPLPQRSPTLWPTPEGMGGGKTSRAGDRKGELLLGGMVRALSASDTPKLSPSPAPSITATFPIASVLEASRMLHALHSLSDAVYSRMSSAVAFHASRTVAPESDLPAQTSATCGESVGVCLATYDPASHSLKTSQACLLLSAEDSLTESLATWPRFGTLVNGRLYQQQPLAPRTGGSGSGSCAGMNWPTPTKQDGENCAGPSQLERNSDPLNVAVLRGQPCPASGPADRASRSIDGNLGELLEDWPTPASNGGTGGCVGLAGGAGNLAKLYRTLGDVEGRKMGCQKLNPHWVFCLMGYPPLWAELGRKFTTASRSSKRQATQSCQK
jgi:hypothetical protein